MSDIADMVAALRQQPVGPDRELVPWSGEGEQPALLPGDPFQDLWDKIWSDYERGWIHMAEEIF